MKSKFILFVWKRWIFFLEYFFAFSNLLQRAFWVPYCKKLWWKHFPSLTFVSRKARSFWRRWTNMEMVFSIFMCLYSFEHYTTLYMPHQFRACICNYLFCQKFPIATAANLCYPLPFFCQLPSPVIIRYFQLNSHNWLLKFLSWPYLFLNLAFVE